MRIEAAGQAFSSGAMQFIIFSLEAGDRQAQTAINIILSTRTRRECVWSVPSKPPSCLVTGCRYFGSGIRKISLFYAVGLFLITSHLNHAEEPYMNAPPLTLICWPVMKSPSPTRKSTALAISSA